MCGLKKSSLKKTSRKKKKTLSSLLAGEVVPGEWSLAQHRPGSSMQRPRQPQTIEESKNCKILVLLKMFFFFKLLFLACLKGLLGLFFSRLLKQLQENLSFFGGSTYGLKVSSVFFGREAWSTLVFCIGILLAGLLKVCSHGANCSASKRSSLNGL